MSRIALPRMRELRARADVAVLLCYRKGTTAVCVERLEGHDVRSVAMQVGDSLPLHVGGGPLALLAFLPEGEQHAVIDRLISRTDRAEDALPAPDPDVLLVRLEQTRAAGYARSDQDVTIGIAALGSPVFNHRGELVAALSISGLRERLLDREEELSRLLTTTASALSADLGHPEVSHG